MATKLIEKKEIRRIQKAGNQPYIYLPIGWFRFNELDFGGELLVEVEKDRIVIMPYDEFDTELL